MVWVIEAALLLFTYHQRFHRLACVDAWICVSLSFLIRGLHVGLPALSWKP
jgi:hypothetical protein